MLPAPDAALSNSADLLAFFQPVRGQHLWGHLFTNRREWPYGSNRYEVYFTYTALFLAGVALFATRALRPVITSGRNAGGISPRLPGKWFWAACSLLFFLLALGPVLQVNGEQISQLFNPNWQLVMPYTLVENLPVLNISRSPDRFDMPLTLCLGVLAGYGVNVLVNTWRMSPGERWPASRRGAVIALGAIALMIIELTPFPYPQRPADIPKWYQELGKEPGDFSILELPPQDDYWHGAYRMYFQTAHGKPIFGGYISREYPHPFLTSTPGYQELTYVDGGGDMFRAGPDEWYSAFQEYRTRYIVLQKRRLPDRPDPPVDVSSSREAIRTVLGDTEPAHVDDDVEVYRVPQPTEQVPFLTVGSGWEPRETGPNGTFRWMHATGNLTIHAPHAKSTYLVFRATSLVPRTLQVFHGERLVYEGQVGPLQEYRIGPLGLPDGGSNLTFVSPEGTISPAELGMGDDPRQLSFAILDLELEPVD
jgi:hypothetical protein